MLKIIQHKQQLFVAQGFLQALLDGAIRRFPHTQGLGNRRADQVGIADRRQRDKVDAIDKMVEQVRRHLQRQPRLADAAGAGQREQTNLFLQQQVLDGGQVMVAPNERRARQGEVAGWLCWQRRMSML